MKTNSVIDVHVHLAALPEGNNECFISDHMLNGILFKFLCRKLGLPINRPEESNKIYIKNLLNSIQKSQFVDQVILLGMDGVYDSKGELDKKATHFLISNKYVFQVAKDHSEYFKAGVSINPQRKDSIEELDRCAEQGAALVKVLPNTQCFDPAEKTYKDFYRSLAKYKIPLLSHVGYEFSLLGKDQSQGDPSRLRIALDEGATVIAAHGASFGLFFYEKYWNTFLDYVKRYPNFYWDASALSLQNRVRMLFKIRNNPELHSRMVFGTDYPLPCYAYPALMDLKPGKYIELLKMKNPFDRHYRLLQIMGLPDPVNLWSKKS